MISYAEINERLEEETPFFARHCLQIVDKRGRQINLEPNDGQILLDAKLEAQRDEGVPMRALALKARKVGVSTWMQGKLIQRATQRENYDVVVLAHDLKTGNQLFRIGKRMYDGLPGELRPALDSRRRGREMHFTTGSSYLVDTATEKDAGRGLTPMGIHGSEAAFWSDLGAKLAALENAVPDEPETLIVLESTANGANEFKDMWDDAVAGRNEYAPFFWPWWKEPAYSRPFANADERERFRVGDTSQFAHAEGEIELLHPGPIDVDTNEHVPLTLEQLNWRRYKIGSRPLHIFQQEFPATPDEAFISTGRKVFDPAAVSKVFAVTSLTDPQNPTSEHPGPARGKLVGKAPTEYPLPSGDRLAVPTAVGWVPVEKMPVGETPAWRLWGGAKPRTEGQFIVGVDVSGGESDGGDPAYHAIEVIDHKTREQVAEYRSRIDPDLLAEQIYLATLQFNKPWVAVEITGGWGGAVVRKLWRGGYRYPFLYFRRAHGKRNEKTMTTIGWDTNRATKPILEANTAELLREGSHGIRSRGLAEELSTYVRLPTGRSEPEPGRFSDRLMAWQIAQQIAYEMPVKHETTATFTRRIRNPVTAY